MSIMNKMEQVRKELIKNPTITNELYNLFAEIYDELREQEK